MANNAGYSDVVSRLFRLLGYEFNRRLADIGVARAWPIDPPPPLSCRTTLLVTASTSPDRRQPGRHLANHPLARYLGR